MKVSYILHGARGKKYQLQFSEFGREMGGGVLVELFDNQGKNLASSHEATGPNALGARLLASWFAEEMPDPHQV